MIAFSGPGVPVPIEMPSSRARGVIVGRILPVAPPPRPTGETRREPRRYDAGPTCHGHPHPRGLLPSRADRAAGAARVHRRRPRQGVPRRRRPRWRRRRGDPLDLQPRRGLRRGRELPRRLPGPEAPAHRDAGSRGRGARRPDVRPLGARRRRPPVRRGERARLDGARRDADLRAGARGAAARRGRGRRSVAAHRAVPLRGARRPPGPPGDLARRRARRVRGARRRPRRGRGGRAAPGATWSSSAPARWPPSP